MLTDEEKRGCADLLRLLSSDDLISLCDTVTDHLVVPVTIDETIEAIVRYSKSAEQLLRRKRIKHDVLFRYLHGSNVEGITAKCTKGELVQSILNLWRKDGRVADVQKALPRNQVGNPPSITINHTTIINQQIKQSIAVNKAEEASGQEIAKQFIQWFYPLLNSIKDGGQSDWGPQHFLPDACLLFSIVNDSDSRMQETFQGAQKTQEKLASLVKQEGVLLNPNPTTEGHRGAISPHGLAKVAVCGTLHKISDASQGFVGVFEQYFGLLRDVSDGNRWKIKACELKIKVMGGAGQGTHITLSEDAKRAICDA